MSPNPKPIVGLAQSPAIIPLSIHVPLPIAILLREFELKDIPSSYNYSAYHLES